MLSDSLKRIPGSLAVIITLVMLQSTLCTGVPPKDNPNSLTNNAGKITSAANESQKSQQIQAAQKAANLPKATFTDAQKARYRSSLEANVKKMHLGLSPYEKMILAIQRFAQRVENWFKRLFSRAPKVGGIGGTALTIIEWVLKIAAYLFVIAAAGGLLYLLYLLISNAWRSRRPSANVTISAVLEPDAPKLGLVDELLSTADKLYKQGNYREALRHLYLASISLLSNAKIVVYSKDKTNRDYLRNLAKAQNPPAMDAFRGITEIFDGVVYGGRDIADMDYETARKYAVSLGESL
jgi:hypothetical protein